MFGSDSGFAEILNRYPDTLVYGVVCFVVLILLFIGRLVLRSIVNKKVHSIQVVGAGFTNLDELRRQGMITDEEYKVMRKRTAERQLQEINAPDRSKNTMEMLTAIERDRSLAAKLIPEIAETQAKNSRAQSAVEIQPQPTMKPRVAQPPPIKQHVSADTPSAQPARKSATEDIVEGDPLSDPRFLERSNPPQGGRRRKKPSLDLDAMLAKGLISKEEYDRLLSLQDQL